MTQRSLNEKQLAELEELLEYARETEQKLKDFGEETAAIAQKWQRKAEDERAVAAQNQA